MKLPCTYCCQEMEANDSKVSELNNFIRAILYMACNFFKHNIVAHFITHVMFLYSNSSFECRLSGAKKQNRLIEM